MASRSAGVLLHRDGEAGTEFLLVHPGGPFWAKKDEGAWSIPKGELDPGEDPRACALRELAEELGPACPQLVPDDLVDLGEVRQKSGKVVVAFAARADVDVDEVVSNTIEIPWPPRSGRTLEIPEIDRAEWFGPEAAARKINPAQAALLAHPALVA